MGFPHLELKPAPAPAQAHSASHAPNYETGWDYVDHGTACDRDPSAGQCMLEPAQRARLVIELGTDANTVLTNYHAALGNKRVELLLNKDSGWGFVGELIIGALSTVLLAGLGAYAAKLAQKVVAAAAARGEIVADHVEAAIKAHTALFSAGVKQVITAAKAPLRSSLAGYSAQTAEHIQFITELQNSASHVVSAIIKEAKAGDDVALIHARAMLDSEHLSVRAFKEQIDDVLDRYAASHLDDLGFTQTGPVRDGERTVVRFVYGKLSRLAVVEFRQRKKLGTSHGDDWFTKGGNYFLNWIDDDLSEAAESAQYRHNGAIKTIDTDDDISWNYLPQISSWQHGGVK